MPLLNLSVTVFALPSKEFSTTTKGPAENERTYWDRYFHVVRRVNQWRSALEARESALMPSPHRFDTKAFIEPFGFSSKNLQLTQALLRNLQPTLSENLRHTLALTPAQSSLNGYTLLDTLGAVAIGRIIASLTQLGNEWLENGNCSVASLNSLHHLLDEWIALGDWVVQQAGDIGDQ